MHGFLPILNVLFSLLTGRFTLTSSQRGRTLRSKSYTVTRTGLQQRLESHLSNFAPAESGLRALHQDARNVTADRGLRGVRKLRLSTGSRLLSWDQRPLLARLSELLDDGLARLGLSAYIGTRCNSTSLPRTLAAFFEWRLDAYPGLRGPRPSLTSRSGSVALGLRSSEKTRVLVCSATGPA